MSEIREEYKTTTRNDELEQLGLNLRVVDVDALTPHPRNYNQHSEHQVGELGQSLSDFGQYKNVVDWRDPDNGVLYILAGHGLWEAAIARGDTRIAVNDRSDLTRAEAMALMVSDNLTPTTDFDYSILKGIVTDAEFPEDVPGLDDETLAGILEMVGVEGEGGGIEDVAPQIDRATELQEIWQTELGQVWSLGDHKLACGDCTDERVVAGVMGKEKIKNVLTDPPYGINWNTDYTRFGGEYENAQRIKHVPVVGDTEIYDPRPLLDYSTVVLWGANWYCEHIPLGTWLVWDKRHPGGTAWLSDAEIAWVKGGNGVYIYAETVQGAHRKEKAYHPTQKPVGLFVWCIEKSKMTAGAIFDPFLGSGTTLIACERLNRKCRAIEIDPRYVAVTLQRFLDATGKTPKLIGSI